MISDPFIGKILGKCQLKKQIGKGAVGIVYQAYHLTLNIDVAVKLLKPQRSYFGNSAERLKREAKAAGFLEHKNVLKIFNIGKEDDISYIVMEYIDGKSVEEFLIKQGALPIKKTIKIIKDVADALSLAHTLNILHRDIKPANILLQRKDEVVKLADFGLARLQQENQIKLTDTGSIIGTMGYTSPEQTKGDPSSFSDLYSLGITFFEMLTGELPYQGENAYVVMNQHANASIPSCRSLRPEIPSIIDHLIQKMMAKKSEERPRSATYISEFLNNYLHKIRRNVESRPTERHNSLQEEIVSQKEMTTILEKKDKNAYKTKVKTADAKNDNMLGSQSQIVHSQTKKQRRLKNKDNLNISGTYEYEIRNTILKKIWLLIVTLFLLSIATLSTILAVFTHYQK